MTSLHFKREESASMQEPGPLVSHYLSESKKNKPTDKILLSKDYKAIRSICKLLWLTGSEETLAKLKAIADRSDDTSARAYASREMARWHLHQGQVDDILAAERLAQQAEHHAATKLELSKALLISAICDRRSMNPGMRSKEILSSAIDADAVSPDLLLALAASRTNEEAMVRMLNIALSRFRIAPIALIDNSEKCLFDRLSNANSHEEVSGGPKVSVIIATYNDIDTLPTALRSLQQQTWQNCEFIVVDDCSPSREIALIVEEFSATDERFRYIRQSENGGAYVARNAALDIATGDLITLHDADDWSHPQKTETQVRFMENNPQVMACTSEQARCTSGLEFNQLRTNDGVIMFNTSSLMWRHQEVKSKLGYWDSVRFGADSEFVKRMKLTFGLDSVVNMATGPLSFQRQGDDNVTSGSTTGLPTLKFGVRKEYAEASEYYQRSGASLLYSNKFTHPRPFPAPQMMLPDRDDNSKHLACDIVIIGDILEGSAYIGLIINLISSHVKGNHSISLVPAVDSSRELNSIRIDGEIRRLAIEHNLYISVYGETISSRLTILANQINANYRHMPRVVAAKWVDSNGNTISGIDRHVDMLSSLLPIGS